MTALFDDGDPSDDPAWCRTEEGRAGALPRPGNGYFACPIAWVARALPILRVPDPQPVAVALLVYRECLMRRSKTVDLSNHELAKLGIGRMTKYRVLLLLEEAGADHN